MKKIGLLFATVVMMMMFAFSVSADSTGYYTYVVWDDGEVTITDVDEYISGDVTIPDMLGGYKVTVIDWCAFENCTYLTSITIPNSVTSIASGAFSGCTGLTSISMGDNVTSIGSGAFENCTGLTSITIPDSVTSIGSYAFSGCTGLTSISMGDNVTSIGSGAFENCAGLTSITIPNSVTSIGNYTFYNCDSLTDITIPNGVTSIGSYAFSGCTGLTSISMGDNIKSIGEYAFYNCSGLTSVIIPDSVTSIGSGAFSGCTGLTSISMGDNITSIDSSAFRDCSSLESVTIPDGVTSIGEDAFSFCYSLESVTIPDSVTSSIGSCAFYNCSSLESVIIGDGVTSIGSSAFYNCSSLESITIGDSVTSIDEWAFYDCRSLKNVYASDVESWLNISFYDTNSNPMYYAENLYFGNELVKDVVIPDSVTSIGSYAFSGCSSLESVTIPDSVTSIGNYAFYECSSLESVTIGDGVTSIGEYAFYNCSGLTDISIPDGVTTIDESAFKSCSGFTSITIPDSVISVGKEAFHSCYNLVSVTVPFVGASQDGTSNTSFKYAFPDYVEEVIITAPCKKIDSWAFSGCEYLKSVTIPESVESVGDYAFSGCKRLTTVVIENPELDLNNSSREVFYNCTGIQAVYLSEASAWEKINYHIPYVEWDPYFYGSTSVNVYVDNELLTEYIVPESAKSVNISRCRSIEKVIIPEGVESVNVSYCSGLKSITLPDSVKDTPSFNGCSSLSEVILGKGITSLEYCAFEGCSITDLYLPKSIKTVNESAFFRCSVSNIHLTDLEAWCSVEVIEDNSDYADRDDKSVIRGVNYYVNGKLLTELTLTEKTNCSFFRGSPALKKLIIANGVNSIRYDAFRGCKNLETVVIPESLSRIYPETFAFCDNLKTFIVDKNNKHYTADENGILFSKNKTELVKYPAGITNKEYIIPDGVETIRDFAFQNCYNLDSLIIPISVKKIYYDAFTCKNKTIVDVYYCGSERNWKEISGDSDGDYDFDAGYYDILDDGVLHYNYYSHAHSYTSKITVSATCSKTGIKTYACSCGDSYTETISKLSHTYATTPTKATLSKDGKVESKCTVCGNVNSSTAINKIKSVKLSATSYTYNNKTKTPSVTVKDSKGKTLKNGTDYIVTYPKKRKSIGKYIVTVTFKGNYSGTKKLTFEIVPAKVILSKLTAGKKQLTATWKTVSGATGYEVQYSTSKKFTKKTTKTVTIKKAKTKKTTIKKLSKGKKYYVKVRAYKTVSGKKIYGGYSTVKNVKVK